MSKLRFLLEKGANPVIRVSHYHLIPIPGLTTFTPIELAEHLEKCLPSDASAILRTNASVEGEFYDAVSSQHDLNVRRKDKWVFLTPINTFGTTMSD